MDKYGRTVIAICGCLGAAILGYAAGEGLLRIEGFSPSAIALLMGLAIALVVGVLIYFPEEK